MPEAVIGCCHDQRHEKRLPKHGIRAEGVAQHSARSTRSEVVQLAEKADTVLLLSGQLDIDALRRICGSRAFSMRLKKPVRKRQG